MKTIKIFGIVCVAVSGLVLAGCDTTNSASADRITALETELNTLREDFTTFQGQWDGFYQDWSTYRNEIGLGGAQESGGQ